MCGLKKIKIFQTIADMIKNKKTVYELVVANPERDFFLFECKQCGHRDIHDMKKCPKCGRKIVTWEVHTDTEDGTRDGEKTRCSDDSKGLGMGNLYKQHDITEVE